MVYVLLICWKKMDKKRFQETIQSLINKWQTSDDRAPMTMIEIWKILDGYTITLPEDQDWILLDILYNIGKSPTLLFLNNQYNSLECNKEFKDNLWGEQAQTAHINTIEQRYKDPIKKQMIYKSISDELGVFLDAQTKENCLAIVQTQIDENIKQAQDELSWDIEWGVTPDHTITTPEIVRLQQQLTYQEKIPYLDDDIKQKIDKMVVYYLTNDGSDKESNPYDDLKDRYKQYILLPLVLTILTISHDNIYRIVDKTGNELKDVLEQLPSPWTQLTLDFSH